MPKLGSHRVEWGGIRMKQQKSNVPECLYHYTSVAVLCKLFTGIRDGNLIFHASSVDFMNDSAEYATSKSQCKDYADEILMEYEMGIPFALCFTDSEYNIPMWSMYANEGKGVCLKFNFSKLNEYFLKQKEKNKNIKFSPCEYHAINLNEEKCKPLNASMDYPNTAELGREMKEAAFHKSISFIHEREWRLMVWNSLAPPFNSKILFKEVHNEICPYLEIPIPVICLEGIILNPTASEQMVNAVQLLRNKYAAGYIISVYNSNITLKV